MREAQDARPPRPKSRLPATDSKTIPQVAGIALSPNGMAPINRETASENAANPAAASSAGRERIKSDDIPTCGAERHADPYLGESEMISSIVVNGFTQEQNAFCIPEPGPGSFQFLDHALDEQVPIGPLISDSSEAR
jgi:hypothetical protein